MGLIVITLLAFASLLWLMWQLYRAKQYNKFKRKLISELKPVVIEKTHYDVELTAFDAAQKIKIIKEVRAMLGLGLKEAKEMVETAP